MDPVSRGSYSAAIERLDGLITGGTPEQLAGVADEILYLHQGRLLERSPAE